MDALREASLGHEHEQVSITQFLRGVEKPLPSSNLQQPKTIFEIGQQNYLSLRCCLIRLRTMKNCYKYVSNNLEFLEPL